jgi:energy-coupling factor transport system ATP-binding protein
MTRTLMDLMANTRDRGIAVVMITHDMRLVQEYADRVVVMSQGKILYDGVTGGLFSRGDILKEANLRPTILHSLLEALRERGIKIEGEIRHTSDMLKVLLSAQGALRHGR